MNTGRAAALGGVAGAVCASALILTMGATTTGHGGGYAGPVPIPTSSVPGDGLAGATAPAANPSLTPVAGQSAPDNGGGNATGKPPQSGATAPVSGATATDTPTAPSGAQSVPTAPATANPAPAPSPTPSATPKRGTCTP